MKVSPDTPSGVRTGVGRGDGTQELSITVWSGLDPETPVRILPLSSLPSITELEGVHDPELEALVFHLVGPRVGPEVTPLVPTRRPVSPPTLHADAGDLGRGLSLDPPKGPGVTVSMSPASWSTRCEVGSFLLVPEFLGGSLRHCLVSDTGTDGPERGGVIPRRRSASGE